MSEPNNSDPWDDALLALRDLVIALMDEVKFASALGRLQLILDAIDILRARPTDEQWLAMSEFEQNQSTEEFVGALLTLAEGAALGGVVGAAAAGAAGFALTSIGGVVVITLSASLYNYAAGGFFTARFLDAGCPSSGSLGLSAVSAKRGLGSPVGLI